jgi:hypothetical protein
MQTINMIIRTIIVVTGIAIASGCASLTENNPDRPSVNPASILQVSQNLEIPSGKSRVFFQDGAVVPLGKRIDKWSTYCSLLMQKKHASGEPNLIVSPGQFEIIKVFESENYRGSRRTYVASLGWFYDVSSQRPVFVDFKIELLLKSAEQPNVRSLICEKRVDNYGLYNYPTLVEIRSAVGNLIEIRTP